MIIKRVVIVVAGLMISAAIVFAFVPSYVENGKNRVADHAPYEIDAETRKLHSSMLLADLHADTLLWNRDLLSRSDQGHVDIPRLIEGGVVLQVFATVTKAPQALNYDENSADSDQVTGLLVAQRWPLRTYHSLLERARYQAQRLSDAANRSGGQLRVLRSREDLESVIAAREVGNLQLGGLLATEGSHALEGSVGNIAILYDAGFRMMGLQHFFDNALGGSLHGVSNSGLTEFGRTAVIEMNRLGIMIDVAHSSHAVVEDVLSISSTPLVVSHTGVYGACDSSRNLPDDLMQRIAAAGGLIGIGFWAGAVCDATPAGVARSINYAIDLVGLKHVALGSDYDGATLVHFDTAELAVLTKALRQEGMSEDAIRAVMGGNQIRFFRQQLPIN